MAEMEFNCPECGHNIELTEQLASPMVRETEEKYKSLLKAKDDDVRKHMDTLASERTALETAKNEIDQNVQSQLAQAKAHIIKNEAEKARALAQSAAQNELKEKTGEIDLLRQMIAQNDTKLDEARKQHLELIQKERDLKEKEKDLDIAFEKRMNEQAHTLETKLRTSIATEMSLKVAEKDDMISGLTKQIDNLKQRAEQGSQQLQGESLEMVLEAKLKEAFPHDNILPVPKGIHGADILQEVVNLTGKTIGSILWETKRTKTWSAGWLPKLREDQRSAGADISVLMSMTMPHGVETFDRIDNIWVSSFTCALPLASSLRISLLELANLRIIREGEASKKELIYDYLTGPAFAHRVEAIVEKFDLMRSDLEKEKRFTQRQWAKREKQIDGAITSTVGMWGDLEGLAGRAMPELDAFDGPLLEDES